MLLRPPLRVFVSHTSEFRDYPQSVSYIDAVESAISAKGWAISDMKYFAVRDQEPASYCIKEIHEADVLVGIIGLKYDSPVQGQSDISYTELEFKTAGEIGIPRLMFLLDEKRAIQIPAHELNDTVYDQRQELFRQHIQQEGLVIAKFATPDELQMLVERALGDLKEQRDEPLQRQLRMIPPRAQTVVPRTTLTEDIVKAVCAEGDGTLVAVTAIGGAGGFGKTTLASEVCRDQRVMDAYPDGVLWVTLGEIIDGPDLAARVNDLAEQISGRRPMFTDPEQAGYHLGRLLTGRWLLVIDDVWRATQLAPFLIGGPGCTRLVTARVRSAMPDAAVTIEVGAMTSDQARTLLTADLLADLSTDWASRAKINRLLRATGCWPVLIRLVNGALRRYVSYGATFAHAVTLVERQLTDRGPTALDVTNATERRLAVNATMEGSLTLLEESFPGGLGRYLELAVFPEGQIIPQTTLDTLWRHTSGLSRADVEQLCLNFADLRLIEDYQLHSHPCLRLHDVIHRHLRHRVSDRLVSFHRTLLDAHRTGRPWWEFPEDEPYLMNNLVHHLHEAKSAELNGLTTNPHWLIRRLRQAGLEGVESDLDYSADSQAIQVKQAIQQNSHLLEPLEPGDIFSSHLTQ